MYNNVVELKAITFLSIFFCVNGCVMKSVVQYYKKQRKTI